MTSESRFLSAQEAAEALGVTRATLYAYTSRGQLRSEPAPGRTRERRYRREDIERLRERKQTRRDPAYAAARALHWGGPALESAITFIDGGRLYYRGREVSRLAQEMTLEQTAALLWEAEAPLFDQAPVLCSGALARVRRLADDEALISMQMALAAGAAADPASWDLRPAAVRMAGARILRLLASAAVGRSANLPVHRLLQAAWAPDREAAGDAMRMALVVCADHELNASAFVARCAASAGASPYDVVLAALATLKGHRHGGETERLAALLAEVGTPRRARAVIASRLRRGERVPGFGHPLYPDGDPRAALLLEAAEGAGNGRERRLARSLAAAGEELLQARPNLDFGLTALARACRLPENASLVLFALGRTAGWIAHAMEQYASGELIRPRARYTGPAPETATP